MDEPFGALDAMTRERLQDELVEFDAWRRLLSAQLHSHHARKAG